MSTRRRKKTRGLHAPKRKSEKRHPCWVRHLARQVVVMLLSEHVEDPSRPLGMPVRIASAPQDAVTKVYVDNLAAHYS